MKNKASVVIIGGGVIGVSIAYNLAKAGLKDVVLLEKKYLAYGATGRCGAGVRQQWGTKQNCILSRESVKIFENINDILETDIDIEFKQKGYLLLAYTEKEWNQFKKNVKLQNSLGINSKLLTPQEAKEIVPFLNTEKLLGAAFYDKDGHANPFLTTIAYAQAAKRLGVEINKGVEVKNIYIKNGRIKGVYTDKGFIETEKVVNAAGGWSAEIGKMAGVDLPVYSERHEILATEPVNEILGPMVMSFSYNIYCQQTPHGSFVMGEGPKKSVENNIKSTWQFLESIAEKVTWLLPPTKNLRVVRQWAGYYNISPDHQPIVGDCKEIEGFYMAIGFSGHGFMLAPAVGILMKDIILGNNLTWDVVLDIGRFERKEIINEPSVV
ncbi:sarcosine oxidase subunit beta [Marinitoga hydrogenitolerans DSM 16785]|uniref:Sarcosine oxidase subunit beta n=1 Tax=Marinitoga hydrogenitolerans (strain DSM 16785 / JCM 12826 / AT1271) TaxID=1122195 RepID=A0A1M5AMN5_MARH1|nr:FAD-binding oxidoreductase [Marinitoga hydrogenitolerans]SHF31530.1 sarcosine oxidase subunit beta [Marinitoga hydrogenitolerans DSM 16785]